MGYNILVVDDSASMRKVMRKVIQMSGFPVNTIYEAENGVNGLEICRQQEVEIILTDLNMPEMDGISFMEALRADEEFSHIPVLVVSTEGRPAVMEKVEEIGAVEYVKKPFQPESISRVLSKLLEDENGTPESPDF